MEKVIINYDVNIEDVKTQLQDLKEEMIEVEQIADRLSSKGLDFKMTVWNGVQKTIKKFAIITVKESGILGDPSKTIYFLFIPIFKTRI